MQFDTTTPNDLTSTSTATASQEMTGSFDAEDARTNPFTEFPEYFGGNDCY